MTQIKTPDPNVIIISSDQTTVCCPDPNTNNWNLHPRVYLDISKNKFVSCPYCGQKYAHPI
jgi:uncharacterized Zn-finger protein